MLVRGTTNTTTQYERFEANSKLEGFSRPHPSIGATANVSREDQNEEGVVHQLPSSVATRTFNLRSRFRLSFGCCPTHCFGGKCWEHRPCPNDGLGPRSDRTCAKDAQFQRYRPGVPDNDDGHSEA